MPWIQIRINATAKTADKVSNMLLGRGAQAVTFMDAQDVPVYEPLPGETPLWGETEVMGLFDAETDPAPTIAFFQQIFGEDVGYKVEQLEDKDWVREWMDHFHPMQFGERLWICPSWRDVPNPDAVNVMLDPGLAFGTGTHPTTALCLQWLDGLDLTGKTVVDFGCGSGILGIAALKLGAARVIGIDIDPQAIQASRDNAERNGVAGQIELYLPADQPQDVEADVVVANILAGPLRELAPLIAGHGKAGSLMALSGVLESQAPELETIYGQWFDMDPTAVKEEWCRLSGRKHG
ncbi:MULTISPECIES: 50S ribosomal protein L11 methyltransferase [Aeromonas]|jgi:ribosomal protein L11 methyltransferase|uniref:50S ribosomal protein L11 methyltransferase n=1 Tax=Aeromonas TaxID=642 RepID=UPI0005B34C59|nr:MULTISPECIES: 50S ribosomal protein L11 methyltransferase [Aeromonas]ATL91473.1 50S ribosomal protein L11 methyltransferase [Aeromonas sp. CU5]MCW0504225.1 50S ribosomal protein L11 methyltransferase [Aeromonas piscicola]TNH79585.1 50S ribosomal protein L11 methyltransferase [Aeromonas sobria]HEH9425259.1 50S ribosomal protein L11 methyltransferase [Aeromonas sobria]HEH9438557.1 50S ribosomal protein L11 methyltransferase [Aeromonas sobria]